MAAGARKEQHPEFRRPLVGAGEGRQLPGLAKRTSAIARERQSMRPARLQISRVEMPKLAARIAHPATDGRAADLQDRRNGLRSVE